MHGGERDDQALRWGPGSCFHGEDLGGGHRQEVESDVGELDSGGGIGEDHTTLAGEPKQQAQRGERIASWRSAQRVQCGGDVDGDCPGFG